MFVEWPLAIGDEIEELLLAAEGGGGQAVVGLQARCSPVILKVNE